MDRRQFLSLQAALVLSGATRSLHATAAVGGALDIIDCHTHFYDPTRSQGVPWPGKGTSLYRRVLPVDLRALPQFRPVTGTVIVEASPWLEDNQWLLDLAKEDPFVVGVVGSLAPGKPEFGSGVKRFAQNPLFRGIRISSKVLGTLLEEGQLADLRLLAELDLALDVNGGPEMLPLVARAGALLPELRVVVNHIGNVEVSGTEPPRGWQEGVRQAAAQPNVFCKISALVEGASRGGRRAPSEPGFYAPYIDVVWNAFGEERVIYGSNWPVCESAADYTTLQRISLEYATLRGELALRRFCSLNAKRAYKWLERPGRVR
jgi:predicted TIM-barrel fold metal-dependent hydrolase